MNVRGRIEFTKTELHDMLTEWLENNEAVGPNASIDSIEQFPQAIGDDIALVVVTVD